MVDVNDIDIDDLNLQNQRTELGAQVDTEDIDWELLADILMLLTECFSDEKDLSFVYILSREAQEQKELIDEEHYASAILRQSSFYEYLLESFLISKFEEMMERDLYNKEQGFIYDLGHSNKIKLAHMLGVLDQRERDILLELADKRNMVAHEWWFFIERTNEEELQSTANTINDLLWELIGEFVEESDEDIIEKLPVDASESS